MILLWQALSGGDQKQLLGKNLDILSNIRLVSCFNAESGKGDLQCQWEQLGSCSEQTPGENAIELEQVFRHPWAMDEEHQRTYCRTMRKLIKLCYSVRCKDEKHISYNLSLIHI